MDDSLNSAVCDAMRLAAARAIMPRFTAGQAIAADYKDVGEAVTVADRESEAILTQALGELLPGVAVIGEEAAHAEPALLDRLGSGTCWIVDPLDGTANFAAGTGPFGMLVALVEHGLPIGGWIFDPLSGRFCTASAGKGAFIDGHRFTAAGSGRARPLVAVTRLFADAPKREAILADLGADFDMLDSPRCAADQYPRIALGGNDATLFTRTLAWDHAAGVLFLNEAGGRAARPDGGPYRCDEAQAGLIAAAEARIWDDVQQALQRRGHQLGNAALTG